MNTTTRREFLTTLGAGALLATLPRQLFAADPTQRPNIIVILADDLGYADVGFHGCTDIPTPHIDSLATNGVRCTNGYVSCPVCSPTRAGFITSRYQQRFGHEFNPSEHTLDKDIGLPLDVTTIPQRLKEAGYATGHIGKWHLGASKPYRPWKRGFTDTFSFLGGGHDYFKQASSEKVTTEYQLPTMRNGKIEPFKGYLTDALSAEAAAFVRRHKAEPFFLYLAYNAPHMPLQTPDKYLERVAGIADETRRKYAAMVCAIDDGVGQILQALRDTKLEENTLIFFLSDNGGPGPQGANGWNGSDNGALRGVKGAVWEGGIRVPFVAQWKGTLPAGKTFDAPVIALDLGATALALAGGKADLDGVNLIPHLTGKEKSAPHDALFWRMGERWAVRAGDWKLLNSGNTAPQLFHLVSDPSEQTNLAQNEPAKVKELQARYDAWNQLNIAPRWKPEPKPAPKK